MFNYAMSVVVTGQLILLVFIAVLHLEPDMEDLNAIVIPRIQAYWEDFAYALRYKIHTVTAIQEKYREDPKKCCKGLLLDWLTTANGKSPKTWNTLLDALRKVNELTSVTREIEEELSKLKYT